MRTIDVAISDIMSRLKATDASLDEVARASGVSIGTVWALRSAESVNAANMTLRSIRAIEDGLNAVEKLSPQSVAAGGSDAHV